jgi:hypothetical protein
VGRACGKGKPPPRKQTQGSSRLDIYASAGWASPSSRGLRGGDALLPSTGLLLLLLPRHCPRVPSSQGTRTGGVKDVGVSSGSRGMSLRLTASSSSSGGGCSWPVEWPAGKNSAAGACSHAGRSTQPPPRTVPGGRPPQYPQPGSLSRHTQREGKPLHQREKEHATGVIKTPMPWTRSLLSFAGSLSRSHTPLGHQGHSPRLSLS